MCYSYMTDGGHCSLIVGKKKPKNLHCTVQYNITEVQ